MEHIIFHIDVNNAFLSWTAIELLKQGYKYDIRNSYAVIGGDEQARHGIVLAKSTPAKKLGVVTAETLYSARKKCPNLRVYKANYYFYEEMSNKLFELLSKYTPDIEVYSIDECFFDYTPIAHFYGDPIKFAYELKDKIKKELGFTVNIGVANNKLCAKMASDFMKPDQVHTLFPNEIELKMWPLPINDLFGIGKKSAQKLQELGIKTIGDLAHYDSIKLSYYFKNQAKRMIEMAQGIDHDMIVSKESIPKGISNETTLDHDVLKKEEVYHYLFSLSELVGLRIRRQKKYAYVIAVILKDKYFRRKSHQKKLINATDITEEIYENAKMIYDEMNNVDPIRLIGIRLDDLVDRQVHQVSLFEDLSVRDQKSELDKTVDEIKNKFGPKVIKKASLLDDKVNRRY